MPCMVKGGGDLHEVSDQCNWQIHAYVFMSNHVHLMVASLSEYGVDK